MRDRSAVVAHRHEEEILRLEEIRANQGGAEFLNKAFRLQREMSAARAEVWRLEEIVASSLKGRCQCKGQMRRTSRFSTAC